MVTRKLQYQNGSFFSVIPRDFVENLGLKSGDELTYKTDGQKIFIVPVTATKQETSTSQSQPD